MEITTRTATSEDVSELARLARLMRSELEPMRGGAVWASQSARREPIEDSFAGVVSDPDQQAVLGLIDQVPVGYAVTALSILDDDRRLGVIHDLFVDPGARKVGVGEALMGEVQAWCTEQACFGIDALALPGHRDTKNFFESFGLVARAIVVHRSLVETGEPA